MFYEPDDVNIFSRGAGSGGGPDEQANKSKSDFWRNVLIFAAIIAGLRVAKAVIDNRS